MCSRNRGVSYLSCFLDLMLCVEVPYGLVISVEIMEVSC